MSAPEINRWGIRVLNELTTKAYQVGSICEYIRGTFLAVSLQGIIHFSPEEVIAHYPTKLLSCVYIPEYNKVLGISADNSKFIVFHNNRLGEPFELSTPICDDPSPTTMIYSPKSKTVITCGEHITMWKFIFIETPQTIVYKPPRIEIEQKCKILLGEPTSMLNPPMFNKDKEILFVNNENSICEYAINGALIDKVMTFKCDSKTVVAYSQKTSRFLSASLEYGMLYWHSCGKVLRQFNVSVTTPQALRFYNSEHALVLDSQGTLIILDVKTGKMVYTYRAKDKFPKDSVTRFYLFHDLIMLCIKSQIVILKANLNWRFWTTTNSTPIKIERVNKIDEPGRIMVVCSDSYTRIHSPATRELLTSLTLVSTASPIMTFYDRSNEYGAKRDHIFIPLENGTMPIYSTAFQPCEKVKTLDIRPTGITFCMLDDQPVYAVSCINGNILFYEYASMKQKKRVYIGAFSLHGIFFSKKYNALLICGIDRVYRFDLQSMKLCENVKIDFSNVNIFLKDDTLLFGYKNGEFGIVQFNEDGTIFLHENSHVHYHDGRVTGFGAGYDYFISSSTDCSLRVWAYDFTIIHRMEFPFPLNSCCVLNGTRKMLVGIDREVMLVPNPFDGETDPPNPLYDNFDERVDALSNEKDEDIEDDVEEEEEEESFLKNAGKPEKVRKTADEILEELRRQQMNLVPYGNNGDGNSGKEEITDEDKANLLKEMSQMTEHEEKMEMRRQKSAEQIKEEKKEEEAPKEKEEDEYEYDYEEDPVEEPIEDKKEDNPKEEPEKEEIDKQKSKEVIDLDDTSDDEDDEFINQRKKLKSTIKPNNYDYSAPLPKRIKEDQPNESDSDEDDSHERKKRHNHKARKRISNASDKSGGKAEKHARKNNALQSNKGKKGISSGGRKQKKGEDSDSYSEEQDENEESENENNNSASGDEQNNKHHKSNERNRRRAARKTHDNNDSILNQNNKESSTKTGLLNSHPVTIKEPEVGNKSSSRHKQRPPIISKRETSVSENDVSLPERGRSARTPRRKARLPLLQPPPGENKRPSILKLNTGTNPTFLDDNGNPHTKLPSEFRLKRFPTPDFRKPYYCRFPIYSSRKWTCRSASPTNTRYYSFPHNIVYDINYVVKLVQEGNTQYLPILEMLHFGPINLPPQNTSDLISRHFNPSPPTTASSGNRPHRPTAFAPSEDRAPDGETAEGSRNIFTPSFSPPLVSAPPHTSPYSSMTDFSRLPPRFIQFKSYAQERVKKPLLIIQSKFYSFPSADSSYNTRSPRRGESQHSARTAIDERNYASHMYEMKKKEGIVTIQESTATGFLPPLSLDLSLKKQNAQALPKKPQSARKPTVKEMCYFSIHRLMLGDAEKKKNQITDSLQQFKSRYRTPLRDRRPRYLINM